VNDSTTARARAVRLLVLAAGFLALNVVSSACGGPALSYVNNLPDGEKGAHFEKLGEYAPGEIRSVLIVAPFAYDTRSAIICCGKDAAAFADEFHEVTGAKVRVAQTPNGARLEDYRATLRKGSHAAFARSLGVSDDFDAVIFGRVVEHEGYLRIVHGYSADITLEIEGFAPDGRSLFKADSRVQYPADSILSESAKVVSLRYTGKR